MNTWYHILNEGLLQLKAMATNTNSLNLLSNVFVWLTCHAQMEAILSSKMLGNLYNAMCCHILEDSTFHYWRCIQDLF
jgi:hypothetical protein